jgi:hypothetical protein
MTDMWTMRMAARTIGMGGGKPLVRAVNLMARQATRETAAQMGYVADTLANAGSASARYMGEVWSPEITSRITDAVLRVSGLSFWTDMNRLAFQMEFSGYLAANAARGFDQIDAPLRRVLAGRGITAADWDAIRDPAAMFTAPNGARFIAPLHWLENTRLNRAEAEGLATRLQGIIEEQMEFAVPSVNWEGRTMFLGNAPPGSLVCELMRSALMYKSFGLSVVFNQFRRTMAKPTGLKRAAYVAEMLLPLMILGGVAIQLKELAKGRDPRPMDNATFWGQAFLQGGGLGIFGDFLTAEVSRTGGGLAETITGPVVGLAADVSRAVTSNAARAVRGEDTLIGRDVANLLRRYTPGTSLWQIRAALDRILWDNLQELLDPDARQAMRTQEANRRRAGGNESWWERGEVLPARAPDFGNVVGAR